MIGKKNKEYASATVFAYSCCRCEREINIEEYVEFCWELEILGEKVTLPFCDWCSQLVDAQESKLNERI